jgi:rhodanese-related sulfurtransferase
MGDRRFKNKLYDQLARIGKALASPHRLELLDLLAQGERTVESLAREAAMTVGNASSHLQVLREARLVSARKTGLYVHYHLADDAVGNLFLKVRAVAEMQLTEVDQLVSTYLGARRELDAIGLDELIERIRSGTTIVLDVRPLEEYRAGHVMGAISIPHDELTRRLRELPRGREIVAYCRGPYCVFADEAIATLHAHRRKAKRLVGGFPEWKAAGLPVEHGSREEAS